MSEIERILAAEESVAPSAGFSDAVMEQVRRELYAPKPIPFPWRRVLPGLATVVAIVIVGAVLLLLRPPAAATLAVPASQAELEALVEPLRTGTVPKLALAATILAGTLLPLWIGLRLWRPDDVTAP